MVISLGILLGLLLNMPPRIFIVISLWILPVITLEILLRVPSKNPELCELLVGFLALFCGLLQGL